MPKPRIFRQIATLLLLTGVLHSTELLAACTAANPSAKVFEATPNSDFTDNVDGTVSHGKTGLIWKRCAEGQSWSGVTCTGVASTPNWVGALFTSLSAGAGWRLPNKKELESIVETCGYTPSINQTQFPATPMAQDFWSSTTYPSTPANAWTVNFDQAHPPYSPDHSRHKHTD